MRFMALQKKILSFFLTKFTVDGYFFFMDSLAVSELDMKILSRLYVLRCVSVFYVCLYMRNVNAVTNLSVFLGLCAGRRGGCKTFYFKQTVKYWIYYDFFLFEKFFSSIRTIGAFGINEKNQQANFRVNKIFFSMCSDDKYKKFEARR